MIWYDYIWFICIHSNPMWFYHAFNSKMFVESQWISYCMEVFVLNPSQHPLPESCCITAAKLVQIKFESRTFLLPVLPKTFSIVLRWTELDAPTKRLQGGPAKTIAFGNSLKKSQENDRKSMSICQRYSKII